MTDKLVLAAVLAAALPARPVADPSMTRYEDRLFQSFVTRFYQGWFDFRPGDATEAGLHDRDSKMPDLSRASIGTEVERLRAALAELSSLEPDRMNDDDRIDRELLLLSIRAELLDLTAVRSWRRQPAYYNDRISWAIFALVKRTFAPPETRLADVIARERAIPRLLEQAEANLENPPKLWVQVALEDADGTASFLQHDVPAAFAGVGGPDLQAALREATGAAVAAYHRYQTWLTRDLMPRANGDFRLGEERYRLKLLYEEDVDVPIDRLIAVGEAELARQKARLEATARQIDPTRPAREVLASLLHEHAPADQIIPRTRDLLASLRDFCSSHRIAGMPSEVLPIVTETPPFARAFTFASMDTPGPFETKATEAYFYLTLPEPGWAPERTEQHLEAYWRGDLVNTAIHEAYPGHYLQFLWLPRAKTRVRKIVAANTFIEGWAHYTEEMLLEQGYGNDDPKLWISEEQWALVRVCRYLVGLRMHTRGMRLPDAVAFFEKNAYLPHANAVREAERGTADPLYLYYTLGKLEIEKLRDDWREKMGPAYTLEGFHDALLSLGAPPIPIARELMLGRRGDAL